MDNLLDFGNMNVELQKMLSHAENDIGELCQKNLALKAKIAELELKLKEKEENKKIST